jgi:glutamate-ammonia-ligase adenylyltransferase
VSFEAARDMIAAYEFLRRAEHRLQMIDDQQTHTLPEDAEGLRRFAVFMGYPGTAEFSAALTAHLRNVEKHYARLFEEAPSLSGPGNLVFTGTEHDPATLKTLEGLGFAEPATVSAAVMSWHRGRFAATRSARARELLTELIPAILAALGRTASPKAAFMKFDEFLSRLPAGVQLFSLFQANPALLDLVADIMGDAPQLADLLARRPILLDGVLSPDFYLPLAGREGLERELSESLARAPGFEPALDVARRWAGDKLFRVGVQILRNLVTADAAGPQFSDIADAVLLCLKPLVEAEFAKQHGRVPGGEMAVIAMGRLGGREMTVGSDLDLVFVYDFPRGAEQSDGPRPLSAHEYFARLSRRLINALSAQTAEGQLFAVDMRLRPSGSSGPIASHLDAFRNYHEKQAWTWEHLALTRARVAAGPEKLGRSIEAIVRETLMRPRDPGKLARDVLDMRNRMAAEHKPKSLFDVKHLRGGLIDVEFVVQFLQLRHAHEHPEILRRNTGAGLAKLAEAGLAPGAEALMAALVLWQRILGLLRLCYPEPIAEDTAPVGLQRILVKATGAADFEALKAEMRARAEAVLKIFDELIAATAAPAEEEEKR